MSVRMPVPEKDVFVDVYSHNTIADTAKHFNCSVNTIKRWSIIFGFRKQSVFKPDMAEFSDFYKHHSLKETARHFKVDLSTITNWIKVFGAHKRLVLDRKHKPSRNELRAYLNLHTNKEAAVHFKLSVSTIGRLVQQYGLGSMDKDLIIEPINKVPTPNKIEFEKVYSSRSIQETANYFQVSDRVIYRWREQFEIKLKSDKELPAEFTQEQYELLVGSMLGDGSIRKVKGQGDTYYTEQHGLKQLGYLEYKFRLLEPFSGRFTRKLNYGISAIYEDGRYQGYRRDTRKTRTSFMFDTYASPLFTDLERKWYRRNEQGDYEYMKRGRTLVRIKQLPEDVTLTPFIVAIWYFDDGSKRRNSRNVNIASMSFSIDECDRLVQMLKNMGCTDSKVWKNRTISIGSKSFTDFMDMVSPYCPHRCLEYKVEKS